MLYYECELNSHITKNERGCRMDTLKEIINAKGFKLNFVASELNITRKALYKKLRGDSEFKASEIARLVDMLRLTSKETKEIFFK
jgi:predicted transcriptional regulator